MPGGNSHQRSMEKHKGGSLAPHGDKCGQEPTIVATEQEWLQPLNRADSIGVVLGIVGIFFILVVPTVWYKAPALLLLCFGFSYLIWLSHWTYRMSRLVRVIIISAGLVIINTAVIPEFMTQWRIEHMRSELTFNASVPGLAYPDGDHYGIDWRKADAEIRLTVVSKASFPIQNLNLSVGVPNKNISIAGMAQTGKQPQGCVVRLPRSDLQLPPFILSGQDGSRVDLAPMFQDDINGRWPLRDHYDLLCQRILAGESIPLVIAVFSEKERDAGMSIPPSVLHVTGDYETTAVEGNKRIPVDETVAVSRLPRWK